MQDSKFIEDLRAACRRGERLKFVFFWGHESTTDQLTPSCFSQWYEAPFVIDGQRYPTAEHFMMAEKAALFGDEVKRAEILKTPHPGAAKALGRGVQGFDEATWTRHRFSIVVRANTAKFTQNPHLGTFLVQTGTRVLVEGSPVDRIWGIGLAADDARASDPDQWQGLNLLGFALMHVRGSLQR